MVGDAVIVHRSAELRVFDVRCTAGAGDHADEESTGFEVVVPITGVYRRRTARGAAVVDAAGGYVTAPGVAQRISHVSAGDRGVVLLPGERLADDLGLDRAAGAAWTLRRPAAGLRP